MRLPLVRLTAWRLRRVVLLLGALTLARAPAAADLQAIRAQPDPVKRSQLALAHGDTTAKQTAKACQANEYDECMKLLREVQDAAMLAKEALDQTGIDASRNPRHHKNAEVRVRQILKTVEAARPYIHPEDQAAYEAVVKHLSGLNDELLQAVMSRRKK